MQRAPPGPMTPASSASLSPLPAAALSVASDILLESEQQLLDQAVQAEQRIGSEQKQQLLSELLLSLSDDLAAALSPSAPASPPPFSPSVPARPPPSPSEPAAPVAALVSGTLACSFPAPARPVSGTCTVFRHLHLSLLVPSAGLLVAIGGGGLESLPELQLGFAVVLAAMLSSLIMAPHTIGRVLTLGTTLAAASGAAMDWSRPSGELDSVLQAVQEARGPFLLIAVCAGAFLGLQPDSWFPKRAVALPLLGRRQASEKAVAASLTTLSFSLSYLVVLRRSSSRFGDDHAKFAALFAGSYMAGSRASQWSPICASHEAGAASLPASELSIC
mmetsp:Transcript_39280/g.123892  ORF Transcript_39280/g.123892 Transcript_39280/m.123892 type:complete len:332 (-) Transcript_39280:136-1131(-)